MAVRLRAMMPENTTNINYLPFPVPGLIPKLYRDLIGPLQLIFAGRLTKDKGYDLLPLIEAELKNRGIKVNWHIVGTATAFEKVEWRQGSEIKFYGQLTNEKVIELMRSMDILLLPSLAEGMPVTVVEAMKVGLTCLVNNLFGGIQELIIDDVTGYKVEQNKVFSYVEVIGYLNDHRGKLIEIGQNARAKANNNFEPIVNTMRYEGLIKQCFHLDRKERSVERIYGSRLDRPWIPNYITSTIRTFSSAND
jgi:glycosyltransferase involved in cell wall biosynthesis